jgi:predicted Zn-dependent peptidase
MGSGVTEKIEHRRLKCGIDLAVVPLTGRPIVAVEMRLLAGYAFESPQYLGVTHVLDEAIVKGTVVRDGRALNDAFDAIGATHSSYAGREAFGFSCLCLPEFLRPAMALHAEMIRTPRFAPEDCAVAVELTQQTLSALADDPQELAKKMLHRQAYGEPLGRHVLGEEQTLALIGREQILEHWRRFFSASRMQVAVAGAVEAPAIVQLFEELFEGFTGTGEMDGGGFGFQFRPGRAHHEKELEQEQIGICFPGPGAKDKDFPTAQVILGVLSGGMGARLFTEVREKQGLVYWVGAWNDQSRTSGMFHLGASTTPQNLEKTYTTLLREIDRLSEDLTEAERERAISGIVTRAKTQGDITRSRAVELSEDLFFLGRPLPTEEKMARIQAVTIADICEYLRVHPRNELSVVTVGPKTGEA